MSVNDNNNKTVQDGDGSQVAFDFTFKIFKETDLKVYKVDKATGETGEPLVLNTDYTVRINKVGEGGTVTFAIAPTVDEQAAIYRDIEIIQPANIPTDTEYVEKTLENALDRSCMIDQQLQEQLDRAVKTPTFSSITEVNFDTPQDGKATYWEIENSVATLKNCETNPDDLVDRVEAVKDQCDLIKADCSVIKADCSVIKADCSVIEGECDDLANDCALAENRIRELISAATGELPPKVNLTTWARLNDGNIYNIPFDDVKADTNRFIQYEDTDGRRSLRFKKNTFIKLETSTETKHFCVWNDVVINVEDYLDTGATLTNGKDYSIFLVPDEESDIAIKISLNKTAPVGYDPYDTRRIGGFHTECRDVGTVQANHPMNGWLAGDIIPNSVWTLWHRPAVASPSGARYVPERDGWCTIYSQSGTMENTVFEYGATTTRSRSAWDHEVDLGLVGWEFPTSIDFTISNLGIIPLKAVKGKAESSCTNAGGWLNENDVRMVTNGGDESTCGGLYTILQEFGPCGGSNWATSGSNTLTQPRQYGSVNRLLGGGFWNHSGSAGPSCRSGNTGAANTDTYVSARGWSRPLRAKQ